MPCDHTAISSPTSQRRHFAEYLTGLFVARAEDRPRHPSRVRPDHRSVLPQPLPHRRRLGCPDAQLNDAWNSSRKTPFTRYSDHGVIPIDNTLIDRRPVDPRCRLVLGPRRGTVQDRSGLHLHQLRLHQRQTLPLGIPPLPQAGDLVKPSSEPFKDHTVLCNELIDWVCERNIPGDFTMDCYFTSARGAQSRPCQDRRLRAAPRLRRRPEDQPQSGVEGSDRQGQRLGRPRSRLRIARNCEQGDRRQWYFTATVRIPDVKHKVRIVILSAEISPRPRTDQNPGDLEMERKVLTHPERLILTHLVLQDSRSGQGRQFRFTPPFGSSWTSSTRESGSSRRSSRRSGNDASGGPKAPRSSARPGRSGSTR